MAKIIPRLVREFPQPPADAAEDDGPDWEPPPGRCEGVMSVLTDGLPWTRTFLDLLSLEEREKLLRDLPPRG